MKTLRRTLLILLPAAGLMLGAAALPLWPVSQQAEGIIGRPLTPMSYAGVARRTTRRAVYAGAAYGAAATPYYSPYYW
jgi:hypothetical protein